MICVYIYMYVCGPSQVDAFEQDFDVRSSSGCPQDLPEPEPSPPFGPPQGRAIQPYNSMLEPK